MDEVDDAPALRFGRAGVTEPNTLVGVYAERGVALVVIGERATDDVVTRTPIGDVVGVKDWPEVHQPQDARR